MAGYFGNNLLTARAGELVRAIYLSKRTENSTSFILATSIAERMMVVVTLVIFGSVAMLSVHIPSDALKFAMEMMASVGILGLFVLLECKTTACGRSTEKMLYRPPQEVSIASLVLRKTKMV